jgi:glutamate-ammonia-ligase adenylyltransferase
LVTSFAAYADYQQQRGSNTAWTWEHQAMTRARCVLGSADLHSRFDAIREAVICSPRDQSALRMEIAAMRQKVRAAHPVSAERFDVKHSPGGMVDIEFAVQFLVLAHGHAHAGLRANVGNIALLQAAQDCGLLPAPLGYAAAKAYRMLRSIQHKARLNEDPTQVALAQAEQERQAGLAVWRAVFGD